MQAVAALMEELARSMSSKPSCPVARPSSTSPAASRFVNEGRMESLSIFESRGSSWTPSPEPARPLDLESSDDRATDRVLTDRASADSNKSSTESACVNSTWFHMLFYLMTSSLIYPC